MLCWYRSSLLFIPWKHKLHINQDFSLRTYCLYCIELMITWAMHWYYPAVGASNWFYYFLPMFVHMPLHLSTAGKFPTLVTHQESLESKVNETKATVKFQLKKVLCMGVAVGNCAMEEKQIFQNVQMSVNFLVSLLKKNWQNVCDHVFLIA